MKKIIITILTVLSLLAFDCQAEELSDIPTPTIYIYLNAGDKALTEVGKKIMNDISSKLQKRVPCARITSSADVADLIDKDRKRSLSDPNYESKLPEISQMSLKPFYLIYLSVYKLAAGYTLIARFNYNRCQQMLKEPISECNAGDIIADNLNELTTKYTDALAADLLAMDICPYKGEFSVTSNYTMKDDRETQYLENCGYSKTTKTNDNGTTWKLKKSGKNKYEASVDTKIFMEDWYFDKSSCTICSQLDGEKNVVGVINVKTNSTYSQLQQESTNYNFPADSCSVSIIFKDNKTFFIKVMAVAPKGKVRKLLQTKEETQCTRKSKLENYDRFELKANYIERLFGPFKGEIFDDELSYPTKTEEYRTSDEKGVTSETISFKFKR